MSEFMKRLQLRRILAAFLAAIMVVTVVPPSAVFAAEDSALEAVEPSADEPSDETGAAADTKDVLPKAEDKTETVSGNGSPAEPADDEFVADVTASEDPAADTYEIVSSIDDSARTAVYTGYEQFRGAVQKGVTVKKNGTKVDYWEWASEGVKVEWKQKDSAGAWGAASEAYPVYAGAYQLTVRIPKASGDGNEAILDPLVEFTVTPAPLKAEVQGDPMTVTPGTKAADIKAADVPRLRAEDLNGSTLLGYDPESDQNTLTVAVDKIRDAVSGETPDTLLENGDYVADLTIGKDESKLSDAEKETLKNYELQTKLSVDITMGNLIDTKVEVTLGDDTGKTWKKTKDVDGKDDGGITWDYTGKTEWPEEGSYTFKVSYNTGKTDAEGNDVYAALEGAEVTGTWHDEYGAEIEPPTDAGSYEYVLTYRDEEGHIYGEGEVRVPVTIAPVQLTLVPELPAEEVLYTGVTAAEVLAKIGYKALDAQGNDITQTEAFDKDRFWGTSYYNSDKTQPFEPIFEVWEVEKLEADPAAKEPAETNFTYVGEVEYSEALESGKLYRIVFTGYKGVYRSYGESTWESRTRINDTSVDSATANYQVYDASDVRQKDANTCALTLTAGIETTIDVSAILATKEAASSSFDKPIISGYDETKGLYAERDEYKKAVVNGTDGTKAAENYDPSITYDWYYLYNIEEVPNEDGTATSLKPVWKKYPFRNSPQDAGVYRLLVSYEDETHQYRPSSAEVIYQISPLIVSVKPTEEYTVYTDEKVDDFLSWNLLNEDEWYEWSRKENKEWKIVPVMVNAAGELVDGDPVEWDAYDYRIDWTVQKKAATGEEWQDVASSALFEEGAEYRLTGRLVRSDDINYVDYDTDAAGKEIVYSLPAKINVKKSAGELEVKVDETKIASLTKVYDGEAFDITEGIKAGLVQIVDKATQAAIPYDSWAAEGILTYWDDPEYGVDVPVNGGSYTYYVEFHGSEKYKILDATPTVTVTITPREVTVTPQLKENIAAGTSPYDAYDVRGTVFGQAASAEDKAGVIEKDKDAFTWQVYYDEWEEFYHYGWPAFAYSAAESDEANYRSMLQFDVFDEQGNQVYGGLKGGKTYTVKFSDGNLAYPYSENYTLKSGEALSFTAVRGSASVYATSYDDVELVQIKHIIEEDESHTITARDGIPYCRSIWLDGKERKGNFIAVRIQKPSEYNRFPETALYENSIKNAGGYCVRRGNNIYVIFEAKAGEKPAFDIRWEDGYVEHFVFDFTEATLLPDLKEAVSPKSLSLISPVKKMAVGSTQQLDVKLAKVQQSDHIHLSYEVDKTDVLCVTDTGYITALSPGDATVTVYSSKEEDDGTFTATVPAKKTVLKVKVSDVTAPKIKKTTATDIDVEVQYTKVSDGYRREFYVLEGKRTANDFETAIDSMKNGQWRGIFAIAPLYTVGADYAVNKNTWAQWLYDLSMKTEYTVYVRNVSAIRTLDDGCKVVKSFNGSFKSFMTTKPQVYRLDMEFDEKVSDDGTVKLSDGSTAVKISGLFHEIGEKPAANDGANYDYFDGISYPLPLDKAKQAYYVNPKLTYMVGTLYEDYAGPDGYLGRFYDSYAGEEGYLYKNPLATISQKGQLKLKGAGEITIVVSDKTTGVSTWETLNITAVPDSITGKKTKLQVGQSVSLDSLLVYKEKNKVLTGSFDRFVIVDEELEKAVADSGCFALNGGNITAVKDGSLTLTLKDGVVGSSAQVTLQCKGLDPVKGLKTSMITDSYADLEFTHSGSASAFLIRVEDARKNVIQSKYVTKANSFDAAANKYRYRVSGLTKKSKYNVTVTALYGAVESKPAKKSITTTLLPASYVSLGKNELDSGVRIARVFGGDSCGDINQAYFAAGNTYTLTLYGDKLNEGAVYAGTDTLTWSVEGVKNATVKANPGTFTATLKAVKSGTVTIAVKSKVTKAVISRWRFTIRAVGDALNSRHYYDENEALDKVDPPALDRDYENRLWIGAGRYVYGSNWLSFKAPAAGYYTFYSTGESDVYAGFSYHNPEDEDYSFAYGDKSPSALDGYTSGQNFAKQIYLTAGQTVYVSINSQDESGDSAPCYVYVVNR